MAMKSRYRRLIWIALALAALAIATALVLKAFRSNLVFFFTPSQVVNGEAPKNRQFRIGGLVEEGSVKRDGGGTTVQFKITDMHNTVAVSYVGILPDLFKEGKGAVAQGALLADGTFQASNVLAKHDENYMPPEAAEALKRDGRTGSGSATGGTKQ